MTATTFCINTRYCVHPAPGVIRDRRHDTQVRLEPRLMKVLCMLVEQRGRLVARERFIAEIWKDYPSAEDSLHQAISCLRKTLDDHKKELIRTVPKKGYILHATISSETPGDVIRRHPSTSWTASYIKRVAAALVAGLLAGVVLVKQEFRAGQTPSSIAVDFSLLNQPAEENAENTISSTAPDGTTYRLVAVGDMRPQLYVNGKAVMEADKEHYAALERQLLRQLWDRQAKYAQE